MNLPGRHHYQDIAKSESSLNSNTLVFSKETRQVLEKDKRPIVAAKSTNGVTDNGRSILDLIPSLKYILADQDINDDVPQKPLQNIQNGETTQKQTNQPFDSFLFWKPILSDQTNETKEDSNLFNGFSSKFKQYDLYNWLMNFLVNDEDFDQDKNTKAQSQKINSKRRFSIIDSLFADADLADTEKNDQGKNKIKEKVAQKATLKIKPQETFQNNQKEQDKKESLDDGLRLETDELLESFKIFLRGYSAGKTKKRTSDDKIQSASSQELKTEETNICEGASEQNLGLSSILSKFLVDDELVLSNSEESKQQKVGQSEVPSSEFMINFFKGILADDLQADGSKLGNKDKKVNDISDVLQEFLAGNQKIETLQTVKNQEKYVQSQKVDDKKGGTLADFFTELLAEINPEEPPIKRSSPVKDLKNFDGSRFFSSLLADESDETNSDPTKSVPKILSFFKSLMAKEISSENKDSESSLKDFLDIFGSFLAGGNVFESEFEKIPHDDPLHLNIQSFMQTGDESSKGKFNDEIRVLSTYFKKFIHSGENNYAKEKNNEQMEENLLESFFSGILA